MICRSQWEKKNAKKKIKNHKFTNLKLLNVKNNMTHKNSSCCEGIVTNLKFYVERKGERVTNLKYSATKSFA